MLKLNGALQHAIDEDDAQSALVNLNQSEHLLNEYCVPDTHF